MKKSDFRNLVRELIDDELEEMTTSTAAGPYNTPFAFTGGKKQNEKKRKSTATQAGYELSDESGEEEDNTIFEGGDPYYQWRNDESATPRQKIGRAISEVNKSLSEMNKTLKQCARLKTETGMNTSDYWKRTNGALLKIEQKAHRIAQRIRQMRG